MSADCARGVLFEGGRYVEAGFVSDAGPSAGSAVVARCDDNGKDAAGLVFADDGDQSAVWRIPEVSAADAVGLKVGSQYAVLINQQLSPDKRSELVQRLRLED